MQHDLVTAPFEHRDGWVHPPSGPGLGVDVREDVVADYRQT
jgi:L-alanine-DL-glutamate epimerase-like enolase superfamily enzyme